MQRTSACIGNEQGGGDREVVKAGAKEFSCLLQYSFSVSHYLSLTCNPRVHRKKRRKVSIVYFSIVQVFKKY